MPRILGEDDKTLTVESPAGPLTVVKSKVDPKYLESLRAQTQLADAGVNLSGQSAPIDAPMPAPTPDAPPADPLGQMGLTNPAQAALDRQVAQQGAPAPVPAPQAAPQAQPADDFVPVGGFEAAAGNAPQGAMPVGMGMPVQQITPEIKTTQQVTKGAPLPKEEIAQIKKANDQIAQNQTDLVKSQIETEAKIGQAYDEYRAFNAQQTAKEQDLYARQQVAQQESMNRMQTLMQQRREMKVDPNRIWENNVGGQILAGIGMLLSGAGSGLTGQKNLAYEAINNAIDRDIAAQKSNIDKVGLDMADEQNYLAQAMKMYGTERDALAAAKAMKLEDVKMQMERYANSMTNAEKRTNAMNEIQKISAAQAAEIAKIKQSSANKVTSQTEIIMPSMGGPNKGSIEQQKDFNERLVPGFGLALTKEDATKLKDKSANNKIIADTLGELKKYVGVSFTDRKKRAEAEQNVKELVGRMRLDYLGPGAVTDSEREFLMGMIGNPNAIFTLDSTTGAKLDHLSRNINKNLQTEMTRYGVQPIAGMPSQNYRAPSFQSASR